MFVYFVSSIDYVIQMCSIKFRHFLIFVYKFHYFVKILNIFSKIIIQQNILYAYVDFEIFVIAMWIVNKQCIFIANKKSKKVDLYELIESQITKKYVFEYFNASKLIT